MAARGLPSITEPSSFGDAFWRFSLALYAAPGAAERCLRLQDLAGWDVNLALFSLWAGLRLGTPPAEDLSAAAALAAAWRAAAVAPLRAVRRQLKGGIAAAGAERLDAPGFRDAVKALELEAERRQQQAIAPFAARAAGPSGAAAAEAIFAALRPAVAGAALSAEEAEDWAGLLAIAQQLGDGIGRPVDEPPSTP